jgi:hypothetical protein
VWHPVGTFPRVIPSLVAETRLAELRSYLAPVDEGWAALAADFVVFLDPHLERVGRVPPGRAVRRARVRLDRRI